MDKFRDNSTGFSELFLAGEAAETIPENHFQQHVTDICERAGLKWVVSPQTSI